MRHIEFMGLPGVGKTTLINDLKYNLNLKDIDDLAFDLYLSNKTLIRKMLIRRFFSINSKEGKYLLEGFYGAMGTNDLFLNLMELSYRKNRNILEVDPVLKRCLFLFNVRLYCNLNHNDYNLNKIILHDESLFHHINYDQLIYIKNNLNLFKNSLPSHVIFLDDDIKKIVNQIEGRKKRVDFLYGMSTVEKLNILKTVQNNIIQKIEIIEEIGVKVLKFNGILTEQILKSMKQEGLIE